MNKKFCISFAILLSVIFSVTFCFATSNTDGLGNAVNDVRNFVGGVENTVENAALDISNTSKDITGDMENGMYSDMKTNGTMGVTTGNTAGQYSTARTATDNTVMGMTSTAWTWVILAIVAIAIVALVWYYSMQITNNNMYNHHNDD